MTYLPHLLRPQHCLSTQTLSYAAIFALIHQSLHYLEILQANTNSADLFRTQMGVNLFFENSTRTRCAFEISTQKLGIHLLHFDTQTASLQKGENLFDTIQNLIAMGVRLFIMRHSKNDLPAQIAAKIGQNASIINAGDGTNEHPTQALQDVLAIYKYKHNFSNVVITIIGDILHSRVAHSLGYLLYTLGVPTVRLVGPSYFLPNKKHLLPNMVCYSDLKEGLKQADIIITLRIQKERLDQLESQFNLLDYIEHYALTPDRLKYAKPDAIVMHPGPINREIEIDSQVADGPQSIILEQPKLGIAMRMAIIHRCLDALNSALQNPN